MKKRIIYIFGLSYGNSWDACGLSTDIKNVVADFIENYKSVHPGYTSLPWHLRRDLVDLSHHYEKREEFYCPDRKEWLFSMNLKLSRREMDSITHQIAKLLTSYELPESANVTYTKGDQ